MTPGEDQQGSAGNRLARSVQLRVGGRSAVGWILALLTTAVVSTAFGYAIGSTGGNGAEGRSPAIDVARDMGLALPLDQRPAFADGVITRDDVEEAIERLVDCVEAAGGIGFRAELGQDGSLATELASGDWHAVESCRMKHFEATYRVWLSLGNNRSTDRR